MPDGNDKDSKKHKRRAKEEYGRVNYEAFQSSLGIDNSPDFATLSDDEQTAWYDAAEAVVSAAGNTDDGVNDPDSGPG